MREAAVKSAIFVGVPRVCVPFFFFFFNMFDPRQGLIWMALMVQTILSLEALTGALEDDVRMSLRKVSHR